jgi:hypothetical protein
MLSVDTQFLAPILQAEMERGSSASAGCDGSSIVDARMVLTEERKVPRLCSLLFCLAF